MVCLSNLHLCWQVVYSDLLRDFDWAAAKVPGSWQRGVTAQAAGQLAVSRNLATVGASVARQVVAEELAATPALLLVFAGLDLRPKFPFREAHLALHCVHFDTMFEVSRSILGRCQSNPISEPLKLLSRSFSVDSDEGYRSGACSVSASGLPCF